MADFVFRPTQPHFFQPILPNFHTHLAIPEAFFVRYLDDKKTSSAVLKSNGGERSWRVKINGRRITDGWKEFVGSHDLRLGDIVLFRHEGRMIFHVTVFGPSGCEKQEDSSSTQETQEEETSKDSRKKRATKRSRTKAANCDKPSFVATLTPSSLKIDRMFFQSIFGRFSGIDKTSGMILLMNKHKRIWKSCLAKKPDGLIYIRGGWRDFCAENNLKVGDLYGFKLTWKARTPVIALMNSDELLEASRKFLKTDEGMRRVSCSASHGSQFLALAISVSGFSRGRQHVPKRFAIANGLNHGHSEITLMDKNGFCRVINLCREKTSNRVYLGRGWKSFCIANGVKKGDSIRLQLVPGKKLMLRFCSKLKTE